MSVSPDGRTILYVRKDSDINDLMLQNAERVDFRVIQLCE